MASLWMPVEPQAKCGAIAISQAITAIRGQEFSFLAAMRVADPGKGRRDSRSGGAAAEQVEVADRGMAQAQPLTTRPARASAARSAATVPGAAGNAFRPFDAHQAQTKRCSCSWRAPIRV